MRDPVLYSQKYTNGLTNIVFHFLPGTHNTSQTWHVDSSRNVTFVGGLGIGEEDQGPRNVVDVVCEDGFTGLSLLNVSDSQFVTIESITFSRCEHTNTLGFHLSGSITVYDAVIRYSNVGLYTLSCENITVIHSEFAYCDTGLYMSEYLGDSFVITKTGLQTNYSIINCTIITRNQSSEGMLIEFYANVDINIDKV